MFVRTWAAGQLVGLGQPDLTTCGCEKTRVTLTGGTQTPKKLSMEG